MHVTIRFKSVDGISPPASLLLLFQVLLDNLCQKLKLQYYEEVGTGKL
jgi:hypothetical protein